MSILDCRQLFSDSNRNSERGVASHVGCSPLASPTGGSLCAYKVANIKDQAPSHVKEFENSCQLLVLSVMRKIARSNWLRRFLIPRPLLVCNGYILPVPDSASSRAPTPAKPKDRVSCAVVIGRTNGRPTLPCWKERAGWEERVGSVMASALLTTNTA